MRDRSEQFDEVWRRRNQVWSEIATKERRREEVTIFRALQVGKEATMNRKKTNEVIERFFDKLQRPMSTRRPGPARFRNDEEVPLIICAKKDLVAVLPRILARIKIEFGEAPCTLTLDATMMDLVVGENGHTYFPLMYAVMSSGGQVRTIIITRHRGETCHG
jgi:hypothetical protein